MEKMIPTSVLTESVPELVAADTTLLATALDAPKVHLIIDGFTPGLLTDFAALTPATFAGSTAKSATVGAQQAYYDPVAQKWTVQLNEPVGGWTWECTATPGAPETVLGFCVTNQADDVTYGSGLFDSPVTINAVGQAVILPFVRMQLPAGAWQL